MSTLKLPPNTDTRHAKLRPTGALLLAIYRDELRAKVADAQRLDPLLRAAAREMAGILALHEGRDDDAARHFARADAELSREGRVRTGAAA